MHGLRARVELYEQVHGQVYELLSCIRSFEIILFEMIEVLRRLKRREVSEDEVIVSARFLHERILKVAESLLQLPLPRLKESLTNEFDWSLNSGFDRDSRFFLGERTHQSLFRRGCKLMQMLDGSIQRWREVYSDQLRDGSFKLASLRRHSHESIQVLRRVTSSWAVQLGKKVEIQVESMDSTLKSELFERLMPILLQLIRNSIDHGIELPAERQVLGKKEEGRIQIQWVENLGKIHEVIYSDDGRGIQVDQLIEQARSKGWVGDLEEIQSLSDETAKQGFFPGLSTKPVRSVFSGLGVGMVFVQSELQRMGVLLEVSSEAGRGVQVKMRFQNS